MSTLPPPATEGAADFDAEVDELGRVPGELCTDAWSALPFDPHPVRDTAARAAVIAVPTSELFTRILPSGLGFFLSSTVDYFG